MQNTLFPYTNISGCRPELISKEILFSRTLANWRQAKKAVVARES